MRSLAAYSIACYVLQIKDRYAQLFYDSVNDETDG
jgi:phosphatidylinositol kinase/protein kinase (PI-3  family)